MSNALQLFSFQEQPVRVIMIDGEPWWIATDVCKVLEIVNVPDAVDRLDDDEKNTIAINDGIRGNPNKLCVNEFGLYGLIFTSRKSEAEAFRRWLKHEVLPSIRKTGSYSTRVAWEGTSVMNRAILNEPYAHPEYYTMLSVLVELSKDIHIDLLGMAPDSKMDISVAQWYSKHCEKHGISYREEREQDYNIVHIETMREEPVYYYPNETKDAFKEALKTSYFGEGYFRRWAERIYHGQTRVISPDDIDHVEYLVTHPPTRQFLPKNTNQRRRYIR